MSENDETIENNVADQINVTGINKALRAQFKQIIKSKSLLAAGLGLIPIPGFNLVSSTAIQISMVQSMIGAYDNSHRHNGKPVMLMDKHWIKTIITSVLGGLVGVGGTGILAKGLLNVPLAGFSLAALTGPGIHGITTYAIGHMFICFFDSQESAKANAGVFFTWFMEGIGEACKEIGHVVTGKQEMSMSDASAV
jgi:uncharacterized protein (DUF697 family)